MQPVLSSIACNYTAVAAFKSLNLKSIQSACKTVHRDKLTPTTQRGPKLLPSISELWQCGGVMFMKPVNYQSLVVA